MAKEVLGHIDCPTCGTKAGMRVTLDRNGEPFGYCEATCSQQLRVGGDAHRVKRFRDRYPWANANPDHPTVTAPVVEPAPVPAPGPPRRQVADPFAFLKGEQHAL